MHTSVKTVLATLLTLATAQQALAAVALDRTRVIYNGNEKAVSLTIRNQNEKLPYLAQGWIEDEQGNKLNGPLVLLPPVQRIEPGEKSQMKVQALPAAAQLPQDRETVYYFNLREIPPRSEKPNVLQIALQTRVKLFYRPAAIVPDRKAMENPWQEQLTLTRQGDSYMAHNPTPYYITLVDATTHKEGKTVAGFAPLMVPPKGSIKLGGSASALGNAPVLTYINDYGGRPALTFRCASDCRVVPEKRQQ
ncbi:MULTISPECIES: fimbria/pilus periplasmic chaperone [Pantoea]|jgi:chaperone protein PapD|uniref:Fimbria/pilus periplasmic chaperone n=1 Tax=Pantoea dispersa TaxID=59814 RepID=A0ABY2ZWM5_9GAMM|nr:MULTISPECIES: fimbria/pilus periplasmic chaperone [Pantoea]MBK4772647.1 fimbria/pilus periplasmic chaperone [Pantoea sp. Morm]KAA6094506.1 fimbria/pilus periplasmic chaperone [Pantoea sp. B_9]KAA6109962.1 fimbria/pilus periplasmic chaperone [Pantoea sp. B_10]KTR99774.1 molecular chaperone [Pantoea dispersa]MEB5838868.1 fimbria/pilus periplasmic chaperone [Pantoea dispersa]